MKSISRLTFIFLFVLSTINVQAQQKKGVKTVKPVPSTALKFCVIDGDTSRSAKALLTTVQEWADNLPLKVSCDQAGTFQLKQFTFTTIQKSPMQTRDFGVANNGIPILARKAIDQMKPGDTIFLKDVTGTDKNGKETKLPNIVLSITE